MLSSTYYPVLYGDTEENTHIFMSKNKKNINFRTELEGLLWRLLTSLSDLQVLVMKSESVNY